MLISWSSATSIDLWDPNSCNFKWKQRTHLLLSKVWWSFGTLLATKSFIPRLGTTGKCGSRSYPGVTVQGQSGLDASWLQLWTLLWLKKHHPSSIRTGSPLGRWHPSLMSFCEERLTRTSQKRWLMGKHSKPFQKSIWQPPNCHRCTCSIYQSLLR